jgi:hypothetical protein
MFMNVTNCDTVSEQFSTSLLSSVAVCHKQDIRVDARVLPCGIQCRVVRSESTDLWRNVSVKAKCSSEKLTEF